MRLIWKSKCMMKLKVFACLLLMDRLNTKDILRWRHFHIEGDQYRVLCQDREVETLDHLFLIVISAKDAGLLLVSIGTSDVELKVERTRINFNSAFYMNVFVVATWQIWKQRSDELFKNIIPNILSWKSLFMSNLTLHVHRVKDQHRQLFLDWLETVI